MITAAITIATMAPVDISSSLVGISLPLRLPGAPMHRTLDSCA